LSGGADANIKWQYGYDGAERLTSMAKYNTSTGALLYQENDRYDVFGNRVEEDIIQSGTTTVQRFAYDANGMCYADISGTGSIITRRVNLDATDALFARIGQTGTVAWYLTDHLGSVTGLMNNSGSLIDALVYDAYGNVTSETSPSNGDRYAYTGRERDVETGLQYNRARWYDPSTGRWITQDPLGFDAGDSNLYRYVNNRPTVATDPTGRIYFTFDWSDSGNSPQTAYITLHMSIAFHYAGKGWDQARVDRFAEGYKSVVEDIWNHRNWFWNGNVYITSAKDNWDASGPGVDGIWVQMGGARRWIPKLEVDVVKVPAKSDFIMKVTPSRKTFGGGWSAGGNVIWTGRPPQPPVPGSGKVNGTLTESSVWGNGYVAAHETGHLLGLDHPGQTDLPPGKRPPRGKDPEDYIVDNDALMGKGFYLRAPYFKLWVDALNKKWPTWGPYSAQILYS
jgi:RHS repeat-associated protein